MTARAVVRQYLDQMVQTSWQLGPRHGWPSEADAHDSILEGEHPYPAAVILAEWRRELDRREDDRAEWSAAWADDEADSEALR